MYAKSGCRKVLSRLFGLLRPSRTYLLTTDAQFTAFAVPGYRLECEWHIVGSRLMTVVLQSHRAANRYFREK